MSFQPDSTSAMSISAIERDTGISKDTLRVWERRYGYPKPNRDQFGERLYAADHLVKLRLIRKLLDQGLRPGRIVAMPLQELKLLAQQCAGDGSNEKDAPPDVQLAVHLELLKTHQVQKLRAALAEANTTLGPERFVCEVVGPLAQLVGGAWLRGDLHVFEEHLFTETMQDVLRSTITGSSVTAAAPHVLLTTFPGEPHGLGLLMAESMFTQAGSTCVSLGTQTPIQDIVLACHAHKSQIIGMSFTACLNQNQILAGLTELRGLLAPEIEIWCGGNCNALQRRNLAGIKVMTTLPQIPAAVADWRQRRA